MTKQYLTHRCLIAPPDITDDFFANTVIYVARHDEDGAQGIIINYNANTGQLILGATQGRFFVNNTIHAVSTNAVCDIASFDTSPLLLSEIKIEPNPLDAKPGDDYGYTVTITEPSEYQGPDEYFISADSMLYGADNMNVSSDNVDG